MRRFVGRRPRALAPSAHLLRTLAAVARGTRVVDLAAGEGRHLIPLAHLGFDVHGVTSNVERARAALAEVVGVAEAAVRVTAAAPVASGHLDAWAEWVVLADADHQREAALAEAYRILTPGGWVWVETDTRSGLTADAERAGLVVAEAPADDEGRVHAIFRRPGAVG